MRGGGVDQRVCEAGEIVCAARVRTKKMKKWRERDEGGEVQGEQCMGDEERGR